LIAALALAPAVVLADPPPGKGRNKGEPSADFATVTITPQARATITSYFQANPVAAKPLPPGIAKNLARGKPLPPGIAKKQLPQPLLTQLPVFPGYVYSMLGNSVVLAAQVGGIIADVVLSLN
jgi:hypothetical protein